MATTEPVIAAIAARYAGALFDLAKEEGSLAATGENLARVHELYTSSEDFRRLIHSPVFQAADQVKGLAAVFEAAGVRGLAASFFYLAARNRRLFAMPEMIREFQALAARERGEMSAEVASALPLTPEQTTLLEETLSAHSGKRVRLVRHVDPSLIGGLVVKMGSQMIDSSLRTKLANLRATLLEAR